MFMRARYMWLGVIVEESPNEWWKRKVVQDEAAMRLRKMCREANRFLSKHAPVPRI